MKKVKILLVVFFINDGTGQHRLILNEEKYYSPLELPQEREAGE